MIYDDAVRETNTIVFEFVFPSAMGFVSLAGKNRTEQVLTSDVRPGAVLVFYV